MAWAVDLMEQGLNPARHIKGGDAVLVEGEQTVVVGPQPGDGG
ncbi:hypothetical protein [Streptomyces chartreusis]